jgi:hypothetical protein
VDQASVIVLRVRPLPSVPRTLNVDFQSPLAQGDVMVRIAAMKKPLEPIARVIGSPFGSVKRIVRASWLSVRPAMRYVCWSPLGAPDAPTSPAMSGALACAGGCRFRRPRASQGASMVRSQRGSRFPACWSLRRG